MERKVCKYSSFTLSSTCIPFFTSFSVCFYLFYCCNMIVCTIFYWNDVFVLCIGFIIDICDVRMERLMRCSLFVCIIASLSYTCMPA